MYGRPSPMFGSCRKALSDVRESLPVVREWSGDTPGVWEWWESLLDVR